ncbi:hypothetical protein ACET3Z_016520 [Daucus carota]
MGSTPHDQLLKQISDSFAGLLLVAMGFLLFMVAFVKDREFQNFFAKGCVLVHVSMALWRVFFERRIEELAHAWPRQLVGDFLLALSWVFFLAYSWRENIIHLETGVLYNMFLESKKTSLYLLGFLVSGLLFETRICEGTNVITTGQGLTGNETISSANGTFELGFFTPGKSQNYYIGIWYKNSANKTVVWVANRNHPVSNPYNSELKLFPNGNLALLNESKIQIWSSNSTAEKDNLSLAVILDNGNFMTRDTQDSSNIIWQSFDYPTDNWLPGGGKVGYNKIKKEKIYLTPWKNAENPAPSIFSLEVEPNGTSHNLFYNRTIQYWSTGDWTGKFFVLVPEIDRNPLISNLQYITNVNESKFTYDIGIPKVLTRFMIDTTGQLKQFIFRDGQWISYLTRPDQCEVLKYCGAFGICNQLKAPFCTCLKEYEPKVSKNWALGDHTDGCIRPSFRCGVDKERTSFIQ